MKRAILLILLLPILASAQYFDVFDIDTSEYPIMKAKFYSIDVNGKQILNHTPADFEITENSEPRDVLSVSCPEPKEDEIYSIAVSIDISGSMLGSIIGVPIELGKFTASELLKLLNLDFNEFSLQQCDNRATILSDFTHDKIKIQKKLDDIIAGGSNDFVEQLLNPNTGLLNIAKTGKGNRIAIIYTDAYWRSLSQVEIQQAISICNEFDIKLYSIIYSSPGAEVNGIKTSLKEISEKSGGVFYDGVIDSVRAKLVANKIYNTFKKEPCDIKWVNNTPCKNSVYLSLNNKITNRVFKERYFLSNENLFYLDIKPNYIDFGSVIPGNFVDTTIELTSINHDLQIINTNFSPNGPFSILEPLPIDIQKGKTQSVHIRFSPTDSLLTYSTLEFITDYCTSYIGLLGGFRNQQLKTKTLHLLEPNGTEVYYAGNDTTIRWEGVSENEMLSFMFSSNSGNSWLELSETYNGNAKTWNIPLITSDNCLIRISQILEKKQEGNLDYLNIYGGTSDDQMRSIFNTRDGGSIVAGLSMSQNGDFINNLGGVDFSILKLDGNGEPAWSKNFGGKTDDIINEIIQSNSGEYIATGYSRSFDYDLSGNNGQDDLIIMKLTEVGDIVWLRNYGGSRWDEGRSFIEAKDGNIIVAGYSNSNNGDLKSNKGGKDIWLLRLDSSGFILSSEIYGGNKEDEVYSVIKTEDGGYVICGGTSSNDGDFSNNNGEFDAFVMKFDSNSVLVWSKLFGGTKSEYAKSIIQTADKGFMLSGFSYSNDGDVSKNNGKSDIWILKLDMNGNLIFSKVLGGTEEDESIDLINTNDQNILVLGNSNSSNGDMKTNNGDSDFWLFKYNIIGELLWSNNFGYSKKDIATALIQNDRNDILVTGTTFPIVTDPTTRGGQDILFTIIAGSSIPLQSDTSDAVFSIIMPEPMIQNNDIDMGQMIIGSTKDSIVSSVICNIGDAPLHVLGVDITGGAKNDFLIPRGAGDFYLNKGECQDMMFEFTPTFLGYRTAVATIRTTIGDFKDTILIRGFGINPIIEATANVVDFGVFELGNGKDTTVVLVKNVGSMDITITDTRISGPDMEQFTLKTSPVNYTIAAGEEKEFQLNYTAKYGGKTNSFLDFHYDGIGSPIRSLLFAEGIGGEVYPVVADAYVGETVDLGIFFGKIKPEGLSEIATNFSATVSYNSTLLAPIDKTMLVTTGDNKSYIKINGNLSGVSQIAAIPMKVGLGTDDRSGLVITEFQLYNANGDSVDYDIEPGVGEFNVLGICEEGGKRLINPNGEEVAMQVIPEINSGNARIQLTLIETGQTELVIYDQIGNRIESIYSGTPSAGSQEIHLDLSKYANGRYYIKLTTPTITKTEIIEVVR